MDLETKFLTVAEIAARVRVSEQTVLRLIHSGDLEAIRAGRRSFRVPEPSVENFLRKSAVAPDRTSID